MMSTATVTVNKPPACGPTEPVYKRARVILISGPGPGKSYLGRILENHYKEQGFRCARFVCGSKDRLVEIVENSRNQNLDDFVIVETNLLVLDKVSTLDGIWQHIIVDGSA